MLDCVDGVLEIGFEAGDLSGLTVDVLSGSLEALELLHQTRHLVGELSLLNDLVLLLDELLQLDCLVSFLAKADAGGTDLLAVVLNHSLDVFDPVALALHLREESRELLVKSEEIRIALISRRPGSGLLSSCTRDISDVSSQCLDDASIVSSTRISGAARARRGSSGGTISARERCGRGGSSLKRNSVRGRVI